MALAALLPAAGCVIVPGDVPEERFTAARIDSAAWAAKDGSAAVPVWRVEVRADTAKPDTVAGVVTSRPIVAVHRVGVVGFSFDTASGEIRRGFRYDPKKHRVTSLHLAPDLEGAATAPSLSADGRYVAYVATSGDSAHAMVRVFPRGEVVARGPAVPAPRTARAVNDTRWTGADAWEAVVDLGDGRRQRVRGTPRGVAAVDTLTSP
ncbi:MAG TPA: hypothetical protein VFQ39_13325 [Longimicrobium sp.]|nr:hypothetical protein [Longimicrobium sp.]